MVLLTLLCYNHELININSKVILRFRYLVFDTETFRTIEIGRGPIWATLTRNALGILVD